MACYQHLGSEITWAAQQYDLKHKSYLSKINLPHLNIMQD